MWADDAGMRIWPATTTKPDHPAPPPVTVAVLHDVEHVQILRLLVLDTYRWKKNWAAWRVCFAYDEIDPALSFQKVAEFVARQAAPLCRRSAEAVEIVLYLRGEEDLQPIYDAYGTLTKGIGRISAMQSMASYEEAARIAAILASMTRQEEVAPAAATGVALPDMTWNTVGQGHQRVATTDVKGLKLRVRMGYMGNQEMWLVDVGDQQDCIRFRARADAISKMGVEMALRAFMARMAAKN